jgi:hypothetical protein
MALSRHERDFLKEFLEPVGNARGHIMRPLDPGTAY